MTICFFSTQYLPTPGGVERYTWNLALRTVRDGGRAIVVTSALPGLPDHEIDADGIEIYRLPVFAAMGGRFPVLRPGPRFRALCRRLFANPIDFAVIQTRMYVESVWAAQALRRRHIPALVIDHSTGYMPMGGGLPGLAGRVYEQLACRLIAATGAPFYGVSSAVVRWLAAFGVKAAGTLPNAVDPAALAAENAADPFDWREALGLAPGAGLVAFIGRLIPEKGAVALAEAVATLPGVTLAAAGAGPEEEALRAAGAKVLGALPHHRVVQLLTQADVYCLPTRYAEGFPTTLLEAAACGCPILCTPTAGTEELLPGPRYGTLLTDTSPAALREALCPLLEDPAAARARAAAARARVEAHFTWDAVFATIKAIAERAAASAR